MRPQKAKTPVGHINTQTSRQDGTFFDDGTPVDNRLSAGSAFDGSRDSHDLSLQDVTRDSVVDNMLLSLDSLPNGSATLTTSQFGGIYSEYRDDNYYSPDSRFSPPQIPRGHYGHSYTPSFPSEYDGETDAATSRYTTAPPSRGGHSSSANNYSIGHGRIDSIRADGTGSARMSSDTQRKALFGEGTYARHVRGGSKTGSKGSTSSSVDFGYSAQAPAGHRYAKRSSSFDDGVRDTTEGAQAQAALNSILQRGRPNVLSYSSYDAAPMPTVPTGSRRFEDGTATPTSQLSQSAFVSPPSTSQQPSRRSSLRSGQGKPARKGKGQGTEEAAMRSQASDFVNAVNVRGLPPIPAFADPPGPPGSKSAGLAKTNSSNASASVPNQTKERPGFFRRVFGSSKTQQHSQHEAPRLQPTPNADTRAPEPSDRPRTTPANHHHHQPHIASQMSLHPPKVPPKDAMSTAGPQSPQQQHQQQQHQPSHQQPQHQHQHQQLPTLNKKNSSFFRRRKKSVTDGVTAPPMPAMSQKAAADLAAAPVLPGSPSVSSLRKVMGPYLSDTYYDSREHQTPAGDDLDHPEGFSPDYAPHRDATVRAVRPGSNGTDDSAMAALDEAANLHSRGQDSPKYKVKMRHRKATNSKTNDETFLADSSGNEDRNGNLTSPAKGYQSFGHHHNNSNKENRAELYSPVSVESGLRYGEEADPDLDDSWVVTTPHKVGSSRSSTKGRVWLEPTSSDDEKLDRPTSLTLPLEGVRTSQKNLASVLGSPSPVTPTEPYYSASNLPIVQLEGGSVRDEGRTVDSLPAVDEEPSQDDYEKARKIFQGDESFLKKDRAAAWLGGQRPESARCRKAYMDMFDWSGYSILLAMRDLCNRLVLKGETQEVDRVLHSFARRWCESNPNHGFKATDAVHTICYSLLLLNTDLHMADIDSKMTRNQFVKNTLPTIRAVVEAEMSEVDDTLRAQGTVSRGGMNDPVSPGPTTPTFPADTLEERSSLEFGTKRSKNRLSIRPTLPGRTDSEGNATLESGTGDSCTILVKSSFEGSLRGWEYQLEIVLKEFYNSIRNDRLPLHGAQEVRAHDHPSSNNLSVSGMLRRTPSVLSKAPSDTTSYRGRTNDFRSAASRWNSKNRSRPRLYAGSTIGSSRTSLDEQSVWSPAGSSSWSKYSFGKTQTSMSVDSLGSHFNPVDYQQSIGFANALSQAIIREEGNSSYEEFGRVVPLLEDETLELVGAPWAKEGMLKHKHHLEALDKKAKDRNWNECFAVIEKGYMKLFSFNTGAKSSKSKSKSRPSTGAVVGGGNWTENAEQLASFLLRQTIASGLPPPGYSKSRPHVWALSLPTGAVHLFQAGTPDIVKEFVSTANYWSARLSKEPLVGGVSNIEYGWGETVINPALIRSDPSSPPSNTGPGVPRHSTQSSVRSSFDHGTGSIKPRLPGDKVTLSDWTPPTQSMMASNLMEVDQLKALTAYVKSVEDELSRHQELRAPMLIAFSPRHPNAQKAMANFEKKSAYLLREIVKFGKYIDSLQQSQALKEKIYAERAEVSKHADDEASKTAADLRPDDDDELPTMSENSPLADLSSSAISFDKS
ncbi:hypothetical protein K490DRAFT_74006 [Saccharata proteae CBS 121410]|uniref:SEC7 domain-containing protein n=1 Tax=Saccharata proteae CBS 121410 TaxID=1314787 RepID=A0A9P4HUY0_9PEZI|nr:hypothetical protein K490DRAFT_74006 [Saccharata proteae CBS 121410]